MATKKSTNTTKKNVRKNTPDIYSSFISTHTKTELQRFKQEILNWREATILAEHKINPIRRELYRLYKDILDDAQVQSCMSIRKNKVLELQFKFFKNDVVDEEKSKLLNSKWFYDFIDECMNSIFFGFSLIQFGNFYNNEFESCFAIDRRFVKPEFDLLVNNETQSVGVNYLTTEELTTWLLFIGKKYDLGLLQKLGNLYIYKKNAIASWMKYVNIFGVPAVIAKTDVRNPQSRQELEMFLKNIASQSYGIVNIDDQIEPLKSGSASGQDVFDKYIERLNQEIAKLILGQTSATDEKSFVGAAQFHNEILNSIINADIRMLENIFNYKLIPFLNNNFITIEEGYKIKHITKNQVTVEDTVKIDIELLKNANYTLDNEYLQNKYNVKLKN